MTRDQSKELAITIMSTCFPPSFLLKSDMETWRPKAIKIRDYLASNLFDIWWKAVGRSNKHDNQAIADELDEIMRLLEDMPTIDFDADPSNTSPEDAVAWQSGLVWQRLMELKRRLP